MRLATFNISSGRSLDDGRVDADRFARAVASLNADILALQEVDRDQPRSGGHDLTALAAEAMGAAHHVFAPTLWGTPGERWVPADDRPRAGAAYGCALLSRVPLNDVRVFRMPAARVALPLWVPGRGVVVAREEPRVAIIARAEVAPGDVWTIAATHLPFVPGWNRRQLRLVVEQLRTAPDPVVLLGDLNLRGGLPARLTGYQALISAPTFPSPRPRLQLDHILMRDAADAAARVTVAATPRQPVSDHRPLVVELAAG